MGIVYSTDPDFTYGNGEEEIQETLPPQQQQLIVSIERKHRKGKEVTLIKGFMGAEQDLKELARKLKTRFSIGGSVKVGEIIIQGDLRDKVVDYLAKENYKVKRSG